MKYLVALSAEDPVAGARLEDHVAGATRQPTMLMCPREQCVLAVTPTTLRPPLHMHNTSSVSTRIAASTSRAQSRQDELDEPEALQLNTPAATSTHPPARRSSRGQQAAAADDARDDAEAVYYQDRCEDL